MKRLTMTGKFVVGYLVILVAMFMFAKYGISAELSFAWTSNTDQVDGYKLVMDSGTEVIEDIPGIDSNAVTVTVSDECHSFALFAYGPGGESKLSDFETWCPPPPAVITIPSTFTITISPGV